MNKRREVKMVPEVKGPRYMMTVERELAMRMGYIGEALIKPDFLRAVIKIMCGGRMTPPIHLYYCGKPDARLRKKFNIPEPEINAYG